MGFEDLVPTPEHVTINVIFNVMMATQVEDLVLQNTIIAGGDCPRVDSLRVRA